jgi:hypothetical protein
MDINLQNIEDVIFFNREAQELLPEFRHLFDQWRLAKQVPGLGSLGQRSVLELLNGLTAEHVQKLQEYFGDIILVDKIDHRIVRHYEGDVTEAEKELCEFSGYREFCPYRKGGRLYVSFWR